MNAPLQMIPLLDEKVLVAGIQPLGFKIKYREQADGTLKAREWVEWAKKGVSIPATVSEPVDKLMKAASRAVEPDDEHAAKWRAIKPFYDNWKAGGDAAQIISGTPLSIWAGVTHDVVEALKPFKIYSVEDLSIAPDSVLQRVPDPAIMTYRERAKKYLATKDIAVAVRELSQKDEELAQLKEMVAQLQKAHADSEFKRAEAERDLDDATPAVARKKRAKEVA